MAEQEKFCLKWNDFERNISLAFKDLRDDRDFFDVTLACENSQIQAHKVILSACSPFFRGVLKQNPHQHPLLYLKDVRYKDLESVLNFMYHGEVNVAQDQLNSFLLVAEDLQVKGLTQSNSSSSGKPLRPTPQPPKLSRDPEPSNSSRGSGGGGVGGGSLKRTAISDTISSSRVETNSIRAPKLPKLTKIDYADDEEEEEVKEVSPPVKMEAPLLVDVEQENSQVEEYSEEQGYGYEEEEGGYEDQDYDSSSLLQQQDSSMSTAELIKGNVKKIQGTGYECKLCGKITRDMWGMRRHLEGKHAMSTGYTCPKCNVYCKTLNVLQRHEKSHHEF